MRYRFGGYVLDTDTVELTAGDRVVEVEPQVFAVLALLVENRSRVVTKEELLDGVWGDRFVSESALTTRIKQARQAVGDSGREQTTIKTVHGRGYRFIALTTEDTRVGSATAFPADRPSVSAIPRTFYADGDGASIAYQSFGEGPDLVLISGFATNVEVQWEHPAIAAFLRRLGTFSRVTVLDKRGVGLSDRMPRDDPPPLETRADDLLAVMDAAGIERATILGSSEGGSLSVLFAASHPERVDRLILHNTWMTGSRTIAQQSDQLEVISRHWGTGIVYSSLGPSLGADKRGREFLARYEKQAATPRTARQLLELIAEIDVGPVLPWVSVPTLVMHRRGDEIIPFPLGEQLAAGLPDAQFLPLEGADHFLFSGDTTQILDAIEEFALGARQPVEAERLLATVLFVDIVDSTATARTLGDSEWSARLDEFYDLARQTVASHRGDVVKTTGDGLVAIFDGPGRGVQAACGVRQAVGPLGLQIRAGLHTAEIERRHDDIAGIGVHIASRVAEQADPGQVWVSRTVTDLVAGTGLRFESRGPHELKGLDQAWTLFEALG